MLSRFFHGTPFYCQSARDGPVPLPLRWKQCIWSCKCLHIRSSLSRIWTESNATICHTSESAKRVICRLVLSESLRDKSELIRSYSWPQSLPKPYRWRTDIAPQLYLMWTMPFLLILLSFTTGSWLCSLLIPSYNGFDRSETPQYKTISAHRSCILKGCRLTGDRTTIIKSICRLSQ